MKKVVSLVISLLLIIGIVPISASAETTFITQDGIEYVIDTATGEAEVFYADSGIVTAEIPSEINGYPVTSIGDGAFYNCTSLTSVTIPDSVTSIGYLAFAGCTSLTSVTIPDSVTSIGFSAFEDCTSLTSVTIPDSVTSIGDSAFSGCTSLTSVTIGGSVTSIGGYAFEDCTSLTEIDVDENNQNYCSENGILFTKYKTKLIQYPAGKSDTSYTIPDSVTSIGWYAFRSCTSLTEITIGNGVTNIGDVAFYQCTSLTEITIPDSVTSIGISAFYNTAYYNDETNWENGVLYIGNFLIDAQKTHYDENYNNVVDLEVKGEYTIKDGAKLIADNAFSRCASLTSVTIPDSVTSIGNWAFEGCTSLTSVTIPDSVTSIGGDAFFDCTSLTSITIPGSVTSIGYRAFGYYYDFYGYKKVENFTIYGYTGSDAETYANENDFTFISLGDMPEPPTDIETTLITQDGITYKIDTATGEAEVCDSDESIVTAEITSEINGYPVTSIGWGAFSGCESLTSVTIPDSVTSIGESAFEDCTSLTSVTVPDSVTSIGQWTFEDCTSLTSVTIGDSVTSIGDGAFYNCASLTSVTIPDSVTSIGWGAFSGCTSLTSVTIPDSVTSIGGGAFYNTAYYNDETNWENGVLYIDNCLIAAQKTHDENYNKVVDLEVKGEYTIKDGTKVIAEEAFCNCTSLTEITIPDSVTSISGGAFKYCTSLTSVTIPDSVTSIGDYAFYWCTSLTSVTIPDSVTSIGGGAFGYYYDYGYEKIENFTIYGYTGSAAETYANENGFTFIDVGDMPEPPTTQGDLNGDGKVSVADARLILVAIAGGNDDNQYIAIADLNGDGKLSIADARSLLVKIANGEV